TSSAPARGLSRGPDPGRPLRAGFTQDARSRAQVVSDAGAPWWTLERAQRSCAAALVRGPRCGPPAGSEARCRGRSAEWGVRGRGWRCSWRPGRIAPRTARGRNPATAEDGMSQGARGEGAFQKECTMLKLGSGHAGLSRRAFFQVGALGLGGLTLADLI